MATHAPMLMAYPNARLLRLSKYGLEPVASKTPSTYKVMREFWADPAEFIEAVLGVNGIYSRSRSAQDHSVTAAEHVAQCFPDNVGHIVA